MQQIERVYLSPKLWYLRVLIIEAQAIMPGHRGLEDVRFPQFSTKLQLGNQILRTRKASPSATRSFSSPYWNEELLFVTTEPFEDFLFVSIEDEIEGRREEVVAKMSLEVAKIEKRADEKPITSTWFNLDNHFGSAGDNYKLITMPVSRICMQISLDEGYDVFDEGTTYSSDVRTTDKVWKPSVGVLEMKILGATWLMPEIIKDDTGVIDSFCVAKYGQKWVRTRNVVDSLSPKWNEHYIWEVHDHCSVLTVGVFKDCGIKKNATNNASACNYVIGKVRIRLSTIETDKVFTHSYPLLKLHPSGVLKIGELQLALMFSCTDKPGMLLKYAMPLLPKMQYVHRLPVDQLDRLRHEALNVVASKLSREEPTLSREVVKYMHDVDRSWSIRKSAVNLNRLINAFSGISTMLKWLEAIRNWQRPVESALFLIFFLTLIMHPKLIMPTISLFTAFVGMWRYRFRPLYPLDMDPILTETVFNPDEFDEEFDPIPTMANSNIVRLRYDRLRNVAARIQTVMGAVANFGEGFLSLQSWSDPRVTFFYTVFCLVAAIGFYFVPIRVMVALLVLYLMRLPRLRSNSRTSLAYFFRRLPTRIGFWIDSEEGDDDLDTQDFLFVAMLENSESDPKPVDTQDWLLDTQDWLLHYVGTHIAT